MTGEGGAAREGGRGAPAGWLSAGRVGRPHGLDGSFYVTRPRARLLDAGERLRLGAAAVRIERRAGTAQRPIVRLEGIEDRAAAERLRGEELLVRADEAPALGEDEYWEHELQGCEVGEGSARLGTVTRLIELPSCEALEVAPRGGGAPVLVPLVHDAIRAIDTAGRRIEVNLEFLDLAGGGEGGEGADGARREGADAARREGRG